VGERFGLAFRDDVRGAVLTLRARYDALRGAVLDGPPSGDAMCEAYTRVIQRGIALAREGTGPP
jgi:hypothetical protein